MLGSTKDDRVFVYFADHGGVGLVAMPVGDPVYAPDLIDALRYMSSNNRFLELVFYMEACESGSMFEGLLPNDANIYATTAANSQESSYGTYCGEDSSVNGTVIGSCLGDLYSVSFLENSDQPSMFHTETLDSQFSLVKNETSKSHAQKVGQTNEVRAALCPLWSPPYSSCIEPPVSGVHESSAEIFLDGLHT